MQLFGKYIDIPTREEWDNKHITNICEISGAYSEILKVKGSHRLYKDRRYTVLAALKKKCFKTFTSKADITSSEALSWIPDKAKISGYLDVEGNQRDEQTNQRGL